MLKLLKRKKRVLTEMLMMTAGIFLKSSQKSVKTRFFASHGMLRALEILKISFFIQNRKNQNIPRREFRSVGMAIIKTAKNATITTQ